MIFPACAQFTTSPSHFGVQAKEAADRATLEQTRLKQQLKEAERARKVVGEQTSRDRRARVLRRR
jgi:ADP-ribose pyrophosphatase YjhB (NUDIX family)